MTRVLLLGGTAEARALAAALVDAGVEVVSSLAGRVSRPRLPVGEVRVGGFGGVEGLAGEIARGGFTHLVDATHPFAVGMTANAGAAARFAGVPCLRLARPGWAGHPDAGSWHWVSDYEAARAVAESLRARRPFVTTGRQTLQHYASWADRDAVVRVVEPLDADAPARWTVVLDRGPYDVAGETALMHEHALDVMLTKDSGGDYTAAKLTAARELGVPVVVVKRPEVPVGLDEVASVPDVLTWLNGGSGSGVGRWRG
ncbi:cobalt-precorrin-6A reductase [Knoellia subterranea]|uniref:Cobalt-precorrin-6x reductase n=1 Tax=Knoellia subterranea KCTC 19937 TaxID=1385521 RepID=A0A0A0JJ42_9MICO|nr:cobalt-precorrin-6A reductase [Knoellia subterranea]KGN36799.1 cobalt-precorrin-6x reductase [Knoellia subterranea KCTC 19937]